LLWFSNTFDKEITNDLNKKGYKLIFHDEFNGATIDESKWTFNEFWGYEKNGVIWIKDQVSIKNNEAILTTDKYKGSNPDLLSVSGQLCSYPTFYRKYGYYEIKTKVPPDGIKYWPAFWFATKESWPPEIDMFEFMAAGHSKRMTMTYHWLSDKENWDEIWATIDECIKLGFIPERLPTINENIKYMQNPNNPPIWTPKKQEKVDKLINLRIHKQYGKGLSGYDFSKKYHTYAIKWNEKSITWYFDNVAVFKLKNGQWVNFGKTIKLPEYPMYILINNGAEPGYVFKQEEVPMKMPVNYCRVYEKIN